MKESRFLININVMARLRLAWLTIDLGGWLGGESSSSLSLKDDLNKSSVFVLKVRKR